jgi:hypothetical protein
MAVLILKNAVPSSRVCIFRVGKRNAHNNYIKKSRHSQYLPKKYKKTLKILTQYDKISFEVSFVTTKKIFVFIGYCCNLRNMPSVEIKFCRKEGLKSLSEEKADKTSI